MPGYVGQVTRPWGADEEALVIRNRAAGVDDRITARQVGRALTAVERRASKLKAFKKPGRPNEQKATEDRIFAYLRNVILRGDPSPITADIIEATGVKKSTVIKTVLRLAEQGRIEIEYFGSQSRAFIIPGVGTSAPTQRRRKEVGGECVSHGPVVERPGADAIFASIRFEDVPVRRDMRRAPMVQTHVRTQVEGMW